MTKDYKGGELEFDFRNIDPDKKANTQKCKEILPKGSLVVFPSLCGIELNQLNVEDIV